MKNKPLPYGFLLFAFIFALFFFLYFSGAEKKETYTIDPIEYRFEPAPAARPQPIEIKGPTSAGPIIQ